MTYCFFYMFTAIENRNVQSAIDPIPYFLLMCWDKKKCQCMRHEPSNHIFGGCLCTLISFLTWHAVCSGRKSWRCIAKCLSLGPCGDDQNHSVCPCQNMQIVHTSAHGWQSLKVCVGPCLPSFPLDSYCSLCFFCKTRCCIMIKKWMFWCNKLLEKTFLCCLALTVSMPAYRQFDIILNCSILVVFKNHCLVVSILRINSWMGARLMWPNKSPYQEIPC